MLLVYVIAIITKKLEGFDAKAAILGKYGSE